MLPLPKRATPDFIIIFCTLALLSIGILMVYSASAVLSYHKYGDFFYYAKRQLLFAGLGIVSMFIVMQIDYWVWRRWAKAGLIFCFILLILVLIIGVERNGSKSWIGIGSFSIQPAEFIKIWMIIFLASFLSYRQKYMGTFFKGLLLPLALVGAAFGLIMLQPDLGTGAVLVATSVTMLFMAGARIWHLGLLGLAGVAGLAGLIIAAPYRIARITAFLDPWQDPLGAGYQIIQSLYAIGPGGLMGLGLGMSRQKFYYLPEPQTDFIFAILAEELGFLGGALILTLFALLVWRGFRTAICAPDLYGSLLAGGIVAMIAIQVVINIGVVIGLFPVTGITLPLLSYGGSSLTIMLTALGLLLNISRFAQSR